MATVNDDMKEDSVNSALLESVNSYLGEVALSPNDLTWADSCLNKDVDASNTDWSSIKDALSEIFNSQSGQVDSVAAEYKTQLTNDEDHSFREYVASLTSGTGSDEDEDLIEDDIDDMGSVQISDDDEDNPTIANRRGRAREKRRIGNVFRPNYTEGIVNVESSGTGMDLSLTTWEVESSSEDIFKVWDLGISDEQDDFTTQLNKAFDEIPLLIQPNPDDSTTCEDVMHVSVDDLVAGMGDLSLKSITK